MKDIELCSDGYYRWTYEFNMLKNPVILLTVLKLFLYIIVGMWAVFGLIAVPRLGFAEAFIAQTKSIAIPALILFFGSIIGYIILAGIYGWKYCVLFEMNDEGIRHIQMEKQVKKAEVLSFITFMAGAAAGNPQVMGTGLLSSSKTQSYSEFSKVKKYKVIRAFNTIKLDSPFNHNQIYAEGEAFEFIAEFISKRIGR